MIEVCFGEEKVSVERVVGHIESQEKECTLVFIAGMHGNEPTGVVALKQILDHFENQDLPWKGDVYGFLGNVKALQKNQRFIDQDLNRLWKPENIDQLADRTLDCKCAEQEEQYALYDLLWPLLKSDKPVHIIDLHTTSSHSVPFITINRVPINKNYSLKFPIPIVMGIEEYIHGPLLAFTNNNETVSLAFEAGQHDDVQSLENHFSFIYVSLVISGAIGKKHLPDFNFHWKRLTKRGRDTKGLYEISYKQSLQENDGFKMKAGYENFDIIYKNEILAEDLSGPITSETDGRIFMPLYQSQGSDGFFVIKEWSKNKS